MTPPPDDTPAAQDSDARSKNMHVLLVEDNAANILVSGSLLEFAGYSHDVAQSGCAALEKFKERKYFAILMDVRMEDMDGYQATQAIRAHETATQIQRTPIIGLTAQALRGDRELCLASGMDDYLSKPITLEQLTAKLALFRLS